MKKLFIKYTFLIFTFSNSLMSDELYLTGKSFHSNVSSFIKNIDPNAKVSISTREISGSRDSFIIKGLRIYDSSYGSKEILKIEELQCSGYKTNDYKFNASLSKSPN